MTKVWKQGWQLSVCATILHLFLMFMEKDVHGCILNCFMPSSLQRAHTNKEARDVLLSSTLPHPQLHYCLSSNTAFLQSNGMATIYFTITQIGEIFCKSNDFEENWLFWDDHNVATQDWSKLQAFLLQSGTCIHGNSNLFLAFLFQWVRKLLAFCISDFYGQFSGCMTNNLFSFFHAHS